jgi:two-component system LytT family response regulator
MMRHNNRAKIRAMVVDDEDLARSNITVLLRLDPDVEIVGECGCGAEALQQIRSQKPDLVFLDVQMPELDGFDVLELLGREAPSAVVFVTAYDQYALRAFETGALDYLLKPFDNPRFERSLARAKEKIAQGAYLPKVTDRLIVKSAGQVVFLQTAEVDWIEAADYYACLHVGTKTHLVRRSMSELEQELSQSNFCRIHRSAIVNLDRVRGLALNDVGEYDVLLANGNRLAMSRRYRKQLQLRLGIGESMT